jgi:hypothetical protein
MVKVGADFQRFWIPHYDQFLLQFRISWRVHSRPVLPAESACQLHLAVRSLVVALQRKSVLIFENSESPTTTTFYFSQNNFGRGIYTSFTRWICLSTPFGRPASGCCVIIKVGPDLRKFWIPHCDHFLLQSELLWCNSRPILRPESACILRLTIDPLGVALQRQSAPRFENCANLI